VHDDSRLYESVAILVKNDERDDESSMLFNKILGTRQVIENM